MKKLSVLSIPLVLILLLGIEFIIKPAKGSLLPGLTVMIALVQGILIFPAAAELSHGRWHIRIKPFLLDLYPLLYMFPLAFLIFSRNLSAYPWYEHSPNGWLTPDFMLVRNVIMLFVTAIAGTLFARSAKKENHHAPQWAVFYVLSYVVTNSLIGIDWVMSLEYPWISTMFPALYMVEGGMLGLSATLLYLTLTGLADRSEFKRILKDYATFLLGFGLFWGGLQYAQYLTIWYGNIPEEVSFFYYRLHDPLLKNLVILVLVFAFVVPFGGLIPKAVKTIPWYVTLVSVLVIVGIFLERFVHILPKMDVATAIAVLEFFLLLIPFLLYGYEHRKDMENQITLDQRG